jgi:hypothetical protein
LNGARQTAKVLRAAAILAHHQHHDAEALRRTGQLLKLARDVDQRPVLVTHLVAAGIIGIATSTVDINLAPDVTPDSRTSIDALIRDLLDDQAFHGGFRQSLIGERMMIYDSASALADGRLDLNSMVPMLPGKSTPPPTPSPPDAILADAAVLLDHMNTLITAADSQRLPEFRTHHSPTPQLLTEEMRRLQGNYESSAINHYLTLANLRMSAVALAVREYRLDHGDRLPATLEELVPNYLPQVPDDPMAAAPAKLIYKPAHQPPIVYSVGRDGKDDGGLAEAKTRGGPHDLVVELAPAK